MKHKIEPALFDNTAPAKRPAHRELNPETRLLYRAIASFFATHERTLGYGMTMTDAMKEFHVKRRTVEMALKRMGYTPITSVQK